MIINPLDAHDRLKKFHEGSTDVSKCCQDMIDARPFGDHAFYIFAHKREIEIDERISMYNQDLTASLTDPVNHKRNWMSLDEVPNGRIIWQPRLTRPKPQTNSMLFKGYPGTDMIKVIWIIPPREMFGQYAKNMLTENKIIAESIHDFDHNRAKMEIPEDDDLNDDQIDAIYKEVQRAAARKRRKNQFTPVFNL